MPRTKFFNKQAISPVIATILLLAVTVIIAVGVFEFLQDYAQDSLESTSNNQLLNTLNTRIIDTTKEQVYIQTPYESIDIDKVTLGGVECIGNEGIDASGLLLIDLRSCTQTIPESPQLTIETSEGILQLNLNRRDLQDERNPTNCDDLPGNWTEVPGSYYFDTRPYFCVMQFEAKAYDNSSGSYVSNGGNGSSDNWANLDDIKARSISSNLPWVEIDFNNARTACDNLNSEYSQFSGEFKLITNREWMTIARDAEQQDANWADGVIGSEVSSGRGLKRGNVGIDDSVSYDGANPADRSLDTNTKAMLTLSNGETIWDLSGNVWEWTDMLEDGSSLEDGNACSGADTWYSYFGNDGNSSCTFNAPFSKDSAADTRYQLGPLGDYNADNGVGRIYSRDLSGRALLRGGAWSLGARAGAFAARLNIAPSRTYTNVGFRCSYEP